MQFILKKLTFLLLCFTLFSQTPLAADDTNTESRFFTFTSSACMVGALGTGLLNDTAWSIGSGNSKDTPALCSASGLMSAYLAYTQADAKTETGRLLKNVNIFFGGVSLVTGIIAIHAYLKPMYDSIL